MIFLIKTIDMIIRPTFVVRWFLSYNPRVAPIVYRLIGSLLIGNFFDDHFLI